MATAEKRNKRQHLKITKAKPLLPLLQWFRSSSTLPPTTRQPYPPPPPHIHQILTSLKSHTLQSVSYPHTHIYYFRLTIHPKPSLLSYFPVKQTVDIKSQPKLSGFHAYILRLQTHWVFLRFPFLRSYILLRSSVLLLRGLNTGFASIGKKWKKWNWGCWVAVMRGVYGATIGCFFLFFQILC